MPGTLDNLVDDIGHLPLANVRDHVPGFELNEIGQTVAVEVERHAGPIPVLGGLCVGHGRAVGCTPPVGGVPYRDRRIQGREPARAI